MDKSVATIDDIGENVDPTEAQNETLKIGHMGWINYFKIECKKTDVNGRKKSRKELGLIFTSLREEEEAKYGEIRLSTKLPKEVVRGEKEDQCHEVDEDLEMGENDANMDVDSLQTHCSPTCFCLVLNNLAE